MWVEKTWPYFLLFLRLSSCSLGQMIMPTDPNMSHGPGDPVASSLHQNCSEGVMGAGVLPLCTCFGPQQLMGLLRAGQLMTGHVYRHLNLATWGRHLWKPEVVGPARPSIPSTYKRDLQ